MISDRLQKIAVYIEKHTKTSYKEIAGQLGMKERQVRYDIDRMNDILLEHKVSMIEKQPKGVLIYPYKQPLSVWFATNIAMYSSQQRMDFIMLIALFDTKELNMRKLSEDFEVSRSSIKNDVNLVTQKLRDQGCQLRYDHGFTLHGHGFVLVECMVREFTRYIYMYGRSRKHFNAYETYAMHIFADAWKQRDVKALITWVKEVLEAGQIVMTDASFRWYVASILVIFWHVLHGCTHPLEESNEPVSNDIEASAWQRIEDILQVTLSEEHKGLILRYLNYTQRYHRPTKRDKETCYRLVSEMISKMAFRTGFNFGNDEILFTGLMNHLQPLLQRLHDHIRIPEGDLPLLHKDDLRIADQLRDCMQEIEEFKDLHSEAEVWYLAMHFIAGMKRRDSMKNKRVLLICGLGYAIIKLVQETLQSEFQLEIIDTIPSYKLQSYQNWEQIDVVLSVMNIEIDCKVPIVFLHPFLNEEDYKKMNKAGIQRKKLLPNLFGIYSRLDFLEEPTRKRVMETMQSELGLRNVRFYKRLHSLRDLLRIPDIHMHRTKENLCQLFSLEDVVDSSFSEVDLLEYPPLWRQANCHLYYTNTSDKVRRTRMTLSITEDHELYFCLISKEELFHIPATHELLRLLTQTDFIAKASQAQCVEEVYQLLLYCESRVELNK